MVTLFVFINPAPFKVIPFGFATITSAFLPPTSIKPFSKLGLLLTTSFIISFASLFVLKFGFPSIHPASCVYTFVALLFNTSPPVSTLK